MSRLASKDSSKLMDEKFDHSYGDLPAFDPPTVKVWEDHKVSKLTKLLVEKFEHLPGFDPPTVKVWEDLSCGGNLWSIVCTNLLLDI